MVKDTGLGQYRQHESYGRVATRILFPNWNRISAITFTCSPLKSIPELMNWLAVAVPVPYCGVPLQSLCACPRPSYTLPRGYSYYGCHKSRGDIHQQVGFNTKLHESIAAGYAYGTLQYTLFLRNTFGLIPDESDTYRITGSNTIYSIIPPSLPNGPDRQQEEGPNAAHEMCLLSAK